MTYFIIKMVRSKTSSAGGHALFRCRRLPKLQIPTYEVIKMKVVIVSFGARHFHEITRGVARAIARWKLENLNLGYNKCNFWDQKFEFFQTSAYDSAQQTLQKFLKVLGVTRYNLNVHFDYLMCRVLMHWSRPLTKSSVHQPLLLD